MPKFLSAALIVLLAGTTLVGAPAIAADPDPAQPATATPGSRIVAERAPAIVTIKFMLKSDEGEEEEEATGAIMDASGLVICSNSPFGGMMARMGMSVPTPTDIKVLVGDDTQGVKAKFLARDTELGLAWLQIEEAPKAPYPFIDFTQSAEPKTGEMLYAVSLMGKFFDRAPMLNEGFVTSTVSKPRHLIMPSVGIVVSGDEGLPIFDANNKVVGLSTLILPEKEEMVPGQMKSALKGFLGQMVLPAKDVLDATARAKEMAKNNPPAEEPKTDAPAAEAPKSPEPAPATPKP